MVDKIIVFLSKIWVQIFFICLVVFASYFYAIFDIARADQVIYLHQTIDLKNLWSIISETYNLNRTAAVGDKILFRPLLYVILGVERWLWEYNFILWQLTGIGLHASIALSLFFYFRYFVSKIKGGILKSFIPFVLVIFFALQYSSTEMVAWHHVVGYLVFCLLFVKAALSFHLFIESGNKIDAIKLLVFVALNCFVYELGNVISVLFSLYLVLFVFFEKRSVCHFQSDYSRCGLEKIYLIVAGFLLLFPVLYFFWSLFDYKLNVVEVGVTEFRPRLDSNVIFNAFYATLKKWILSLFLPASVVLHTGGRIEGDSSFIFGSWLAEYGLVLLLMLVLSVFLLFVFSMFKQYKAGSYNFVWKNFLAGFFYLILAVAYSLIIVVGRGLDRGVMRVLENNTYYPYVFLLFLLMALFHFVFIFYSESIKFNRVLLFVVLFCFFNIALIGGYKVHLIHKKMYYGYSSSFRYFMDEVNNLRKVYGNDNFTFHLSEDCQEPVSYHLNWFQPHAKEKKEYYSFAYALFPKEFRYNGEGQFSINCSEKMIFGSNGFNKSVHGYNRAFDGSVKADSFWEAEIYSPVSVTIQYKKLKKINEYSFISGETGERMPNSWEIQGSLNGYDWKTIDIKEDINNWGAFDKKTFYLDTGSGYFFYKIIFKGSVDKKILRIYEIEIG